MKYADVGGAGLLILCLCWIDACLVGVVSDESVGPRVPVGLGSGLDVHVFTRAACSMAICMFCLNSSDEFGSASVELVS